MPGADEDANRVAALIDRVGHKLTDIHATLDSHHSLDIAHPGMWLNATDGSNVSPFTVISAADIRTGRYRTRSPALTKRALRYTEELEAKGRYQLMVWPEHCVVGSWGHGLAAPFMDALRRWEQQNVANVNFIAKGVSPFTEHYGALEAEVPDAADPQTQLNIGFLEVLRTADVIGLVGEASSHCVRATIDQIVEWIGDEHLRKIHLLTDCMSPVPALGVAPETDFPAIAAKHHQDMAARGLVLCKAEEFLA